MPLAQRTVLPTFLGRRAIPEDEQTEEVSLTAACHNAAMGAIVQLASLVRHADDIFCDLAEECQLVFERAESITSRVQALDTAARQLDSTEVNIPVGTLEKFAAVENHHVAKHGFDCDLFTPERRPHCVRFSYAQCETTPVHALRGADMYRKDGQSGPFLFKLWPIALRDAVTPLDAGGEEFAQGKSFPPMARRHKPIKLRPRPKTIHSIDHAILQEAQALAGGSDTAPGGRAGSSGDKKLDGALSQSQPSVMVSVDTSGAGFERMASFRQSQRGLNEGGRRGTLERKRRRRTVSGVPDNIMQEIEQFEQDRRIQRGPSRNYSLDDLDPIDLEARDKVMQQYLLDIDAAREEREEEAYAAGQREGKLLKFLPCRRSRSLPRCVQLMASSSTPQDGGGGDSIRRSKQRSSKSPLASLSRLSLYTKRGGQTNSSTSNSQKCRIEADADDDEILRLDPRPTTAILSDSRRYSSNASLGSSGSGHGRTARSLVRRGSKPGGGSLKRHSAVIGEKLRSLVNSTLLRPRPKSLDLDAIGYDDNSRNSSVSPSRIAASSPSVAAAANGDTGKGGGSKKRWSRRENSTERSSSLNRVGSKATTKDPSTPAPSSATNTTTAEMTPAVSRESAIGPGHYYYFDSNHTLPRAQARKYDFPWDSLPKDWTTSVKLREISRRRKEDRQSSSGNWSQSNISSNRQSIESEAAKSAGGAQTGSSSRLSHHSQGRDSGRGSPRDFPRSRHDLDPGYMGDAASTESVVSSTSSTVPDSSATSTTAAEGSSCSGDDWLRALAERAASRGDVTSTSAEALSRLSRLTRQNIRNLDLLVPGRGRGSDQKGGAAKMDGDDESVYSLDQEGFYTSFHTDSGLKRNSMEMLDAEGESSTDHYDFDEDLILAPRGVRESRSLQSVSSTSTLGSAIFRPQLDRDTCPSSASVSSPDLVVLSMAGKNNKASGGSKRSGNGGAPAAVFPVMGIPNVEENEEDKDCLAHGDTGTLKAYKKKTKSPPPPPPPPRSSSLSNSTSSKLSATISNEITATSNNHGSNSSLASNCSGAETAEPSSPTPAPPSMSSSPEDGSDHETIYARLKLKTSISVHAFPSWCAGLVSDDEDLASLKANNPLSASHERLHAEAYEVHDMFHKGRDSNLLPGSAKQGHSPFTTTNVHLEDRDFPLNSWPRGKRKSGGVGITAPFLQPGILKTPEKEKFSRGDGERGGGGGVGIPKTLNFDPVVNLFDAQTPHGVPVPLSRLSSSDESGTSPRAGDMSEPTLKTSPISISGFYGGKEIGESTKVLPSPYRSSSFISSTPTTLKYPNGRKTDEEKEDGNDHSHNYYSKSKDNTYTNNSSEAFPATSFAVHSGSMASIDSLDATLQRSGPGRWSSLTSSCSTIALSDIDSSSLTNVSMDVVSPSPPRVDNDNPSPASSTLSLNWDTDDTPNPTPAATPARVRHKPSGETPSSTRSSNDEILFGQAEKGPIQNPGSTVSASDSSVPKQTYDTVTSAISTMTSRLMSNASHGTSPSGSLPSSASQTPTMTPNPDHIPPMKPIDMSYMLGSSGARGSDSNNNKNSNNNNNNNKESVFKFPETISTQSFSICANTTPFHQAPLNDPREQKSSKPPQLPTNPPTSHWAASSSSSRRKNSPLVPHKGDDSQLSFQTGSAPGSIKESDQKQTSQKRSSPCDIRSPADSGFGSPSVFSQPSVAVQPFQHFPPPALSTSSSQSPHTSQQPRTSQTMPKTTPFIKPQLLREARMGQDGIAFTKQPYGFPSDNVNAKAQNGLKYGSTASVGSSHSSQESLSSHMSSSSTSQLVSRQGRTDLSQPSMRAGTSSESLHSNSSAGRSDSYRVALLAEADQVSLIQDRKASVSSRTRDPGSGGLKSNSTNVVNGKSLYGLNSSSASSSLAVNRAHPNSSPSSFSHRRPHLAKSVSAPAPSNDLNTPPGSQNTVTHQNGINHMSGSYNRYTMTKSHTSPEEEPVSRADSYRCAMQSSQAAFLHGRDMAGRNSSYRLATHDDDDDDDIVVNLGSGGGNSRMDGCNLWTGGPGGSRDMRRMGITDVDQLKGMPSSGPRSGLDTQHARKRFGVRSEGDATGGKTVHPDSKKSVRNSGSGVGGGGIAGVTYRDKSGTKQQKLQSSSYIRFDPIFESGEDLRASKESLRPPSIVSVRTLAQMGGSKETLVSNAGSRGQGEARHNESRSPARRRSGSRGRRGSGDEDGVRGGGGLSIFGSIKTTIKSIGSSGKGD